jgi:uncharacterized protein DUF4911
VRRRRGREGRRWISQARSAYLVPPMASPAFGSLSRRTEDDEDQGDASRSARRPPSGGKARTPRGLPIPLVSAGLRVHRVLVRPPDVVYVKSILEASEGLGAIFAERGGELFMAAPFERAADLEELLADLALEIGALVEPASFAAEDSAVPVQVLAEPKLPRSTR